MGEFGKPSNHDAVIGCKNTLLNRVCMFLCVHIHVHACVYSFMYIYSYTSYGCRCIYRYRYEYRTVQTCMYASMFRCTDNRSFWICKKVYPDKRFLKKQTSSVMRLTARRRCFPFPWRMARRLWHVRVVIAWLTKFGRRSLLVMCSPLVAAGIFTIHVFQLRVA